METHASIREVKSERGRETEAERTTEKKKEGEMK